MDSVESIQAFLNRPRFAGKKRDWDAQRVYNLSSPLPLRGGISDHQSEKLYKVLTECQAKGTASVTFGALDSVMVISMAPFTTSIYVSGWQCSSTASTTNEPGPDLADYPYTTVPNKVDQLVRAQELHSRRQREARSRMTPEQLAATPEIDYWRPVVADADTGHGGVTAVMRLTKLMIQAGAAGMHIEDQLAGAKKCGHMGGKVLVSMKQHIARLQACRLEADINRAGIFIVGRTDSDSAKYIDCNIDPRDHSFILGVWTHNGERKETTYREAVRTVLKEKGDAAALAKWEASHFVLAPEISHKDAVAQATSLGVNIAWDWEALRSSEGFYAVQCGVDYAIARGIAFSPYCDICWMETAKPVVAQAKQFADGVKSVYPKQFLAYNLSPSFNWDAAGMTDAQLKSFPSDLAKLGFCWQFITLAGFHAEGLITHDFAKAFEQDGMLAYCEHIQRKERDHGVPLLTHQKWSGSELIDSLCQLVNPSNVTSIMGEGVTETQFGK